MERIDCSDALALWRVGALGTFGLPCLASGLWALASRLSTQIDCSDALALWRVGALGTFALPCPASGLWALASGQLSQDYLYK